MAMRSQRHVGKARAVTSQTLRQGLSPSTARVPSTQDCDQRTSAALKAASSSPSPGVSPQALPGGVPRGGGRSAPPPCVTAYLRRGVSRGVPRLLGDRAAPSPASLPSCSSRSSRLGPVPSERARSTSVQTRVPGAASRPGKQPPGRRWTPPARTPLQPPPLPPAGSRAEGWAARLAGPGGRMRGRRGPHSRRSSGGNGAAGVTGWGAPVSAGAGRRGWAGWRLSEPPAGGLGKGSGPPPSSPSAALVPSPVQEEAREIIPTLGFSLKPSIGDVRSRSPRSWDFCRGFLAD